MLDINEGRDYHIIIDLDLSLNKEYIFDRTKNNY